MLNVDNFSFIIFNPLSVVGKSKVDNVHRIVSLLGLHSKESFLTEM